MAAVIAITACSSDDDASTSTVNNNNYMPMTVNNTWDYDLSDGTNQSTESLEVTAVNSGSYSLTSNPDPAVGFMTNLLSSGELSYDMGQLLINGTIGFDFQGVNNISINLTDATLFDQNASANTVLHTQSDSDSQTIQGIDLDFDYTVSNVQMADQSSITVGSTTYNDVLHTQLIIQLKVTTQVVAGPVVQTVTLLREQDVIVVDNYWASDIGLVQSINELDYELENIPGVNLPIPQSDNIITNQDLTTYSLN